LEGQIDVSQRSPNAHDKPARPAPRNCWTTRTH